MINSKQSSDRTMGCGAMWIHIGVLAGFHVPMDSQRLKVWSCFDYYGIFIIHSHQYIYNKVQNNDELGNLREKKLWQSCTLHVISSDRGGHFRKCLGPFSGLLSVYTTLTSHKRHFLQDAIRIDDVLVIVQIANIKFQIFDH